MKNKKETPKKKASSINKKTPKKKKAAPKKKAPSKIKSTPTLRTQFNAFIAHDKLHSIAPDVEYLWNVYCFSERCYKSDHFTSREQAAIDASGCVKAMHRTRLDREIIG